VFHAPDDRSFDFLLCHDALPPWRSKICEVPSSAAAGVWRDLLGEPGMTVTDLYYDPYDYTIDADPYPVWRRLRDEAPVYRNDKHGFYALSRYDDVLQGLLDNETFQSSHGIVLEMIADEPYENLPMMIMMDPPQHTRLRKLVSRAFTPRRIADLEVKIAALCHELLDSVDREDEFDYVGRFAGILPPTVILSLVGYPEGHAQEFRELADKSLHIEEGGTMQGERELRRSLVDELGGIVNDAFAILPELMEQRRADPQDDLITALVHAEIEEEGETRTLTLEEIVAFVQLLSSAGTETVARLLGFAAVTLAQFPDQRQLLVDDPSLIPNAIEELLRYEAPSPIQGRWVARDVELHGTVIPRGSRLALLNGSADRDDRHFPDPDTFDVRRVIDRHLAFGYGTHFCIGAALARLEGRVALQATLRRYPTWDVDTSRLERVHTSTVRGYSSVPMRVR
jgi:cytochrome P450